jgi:hypothetical protein
MLSFRCFSVYDDANKNYKLIITQFNDPFNFIDDVRFQVLTAASMMFRIVFWDVLPCKIIVDNHFTRQYIPEDNYELH